MDINLLTYLLVCYIIGFFIVKYGRADGMQTVEIGMMFLLSPIWIPFMVIIGSVMGVIYGIGTLLENKPKQRDKQDKVVNNFKYEP